jgi:NADPH:quinone reductase-like Zn-dependent oxidoreductase
MKAAVYTRFGPPEVVRIAEIADPVPGEADVLIRVHATTVTTGDWRMRARIMPAPIFTLIAPLVLGIFGPRKKVLGTECAGVVEAVGAKVTMFKPGDRVVAAVGMKMGAHAELVTIREDAAIVKIPANLSFEEAVAIPFGGLVALHCLRDLAKIKPGQKLLVIGASGSIGVAAVQLGKHMGAHVTGVCSTANVELVRTLGASAVIDRTARDCTRGPETYDVILDTVGATSFAKCKRVLAPGGQFLAVLMGVTEFWQMLWTRFIGSRRVRGAIVTEKKPDLEHLISLAQAGHLRPVIDRTYPLNDIVEAHRRVDTGRKVGSVVVRVRPESVRSA